MNVSAVTTPTRERQRGGIKDLPLPPASVVETTMVTVAANRQLADILGHGLYPLVRQYLGYRESNAGNCL